MKTKTTDLLMKNDVFGWLALGTGLILLIPWLGMQFSSQVNWGREDFIIIGALLFGMGTLFILLARKVTKPMHRMLIGLAVAFAVLWLWAELAVGIFTNWGS
jgi:hypothetical protein